MWFKKSKPASQYKNKAVITMLKPVPITHRTTSQTSQIYQALKTAGRYGQTNYELSRICLSWHRRIGDLRADGVNINTVRMSRGSFKYYLNEE